MLWSINTTPTGLRVTHLSSWFTEQRRFSQVTSVMTRPVWRLTSKLITSGPVKTHFDLLIEKHDLEAARSVIYQQDLRRYHSRRVKSRTFQEGDLVLRLIQDLCDAHKLSPPWEGPFVVCKHLHNGSYYLIDVREHKDSRKSEEETRRRGISPIFGLTILEPPTLNMYIF